MDKICCSAAPGRAGPWRSGFSERIPCTVCVATEYGETLLPDGARPTWAAWIGMRGRP